MLSRYATAAMPCTNLNPKQADTDTKCLNKLKNQQCRLSIRGLGQQGEQLLLQSSESPTEPAFLCSRAQQQGSEHMPISSSQCTTAA